MKLFRIIKHNKTILLIIILAVLVVLVGQKLTRNNSDTTNTSNTLTQQVKKGTLKSAVSASGVIQTANYISITTSANGIVNKVYVKEGEKVAKGQKIMEITLDSEGERSLADAYSNYLKSKNTLDTAKNNLLSSETLMIQKKEAFETEKVENSYQTHDERISYKFAESDYIKAKTDYELDKTEIQQLELNVKSSFAQYQAQSATITAPADGIISNIIAIEGIQISNSVTSDRSVQTVASIRRDGTPIASLNITEVDINKILVGQKVELELSSIGDQKFIGTVTGIDKTGTSTNGVANYPVIIKFDDNSDRVLPNMSVSADIIIETKNNVLYLPTSAITTNNGVKTVNIIENGNTKTVDVTTGITDSTNTEIVSGLTEGQQVLIQTLPTSGFTDTTTNRNNIGIPGFGATNRR